MTRSFTSKAIRGGLAATLLATTLGARADEFSVTNNLDSGPGSLRFAIQSANVVAGSHTIRFDGAIGVITAMTPLPAFASPIVFDASDATGTVSVDGVLSGAALTLTGGTFFLPADNSQAMTTVRDAVLEVDDQEALSAGFGLLVLEGGELRTPASFVGHFPIRVGVGGGRLRQTAGVGSASYWGHIQLDDSLTAISSGDLQFGGGILGPGGLTVSGSTVHFPVFCIAKEYSGPTLIEGGAGLRVGEHHALSPVSNYTLNPGANLSLSSTSQTVRTLTGSGSVRLNDPAELEVGAGGGSGTFAGDLVGDGNLLVVHGELTLTGTNSFSGRIVVIFSARLVVDGTLLPESVVNVGFATLSGGGTVGGVNVNSFAVLAPGGSPGLLRTSDLRVSDLGSVRVEILGTGAGIGHDSVDVSGSVTLEDAELELAIGFAAAGGTTFLVIANDGTDPVNGIFDGLPEGALVTAAGATYRISYTGGDGNDVTLRALTVPGAPTGLTATPGSGAATFSFLPPADDGGTPITGYQVTCDAGPLTAIGPSSPISVGGLASGVTYLCSVSASNEVGSGPASAPIPVLLGGAVEVPTLHALGVALLIAGLAGLGLRRLRGVART